MYPIYQNDAVGDYDSDLNGNNSSISSSHGSSDDDETAAMLTSPDSLDSNSSPEDLLVHRLSGQCHTSFDLTEWEEYIAPNVQTVISDVNSNFSRISEKTQRRVFAHLEEVVFDIPLDGMLHEKKCTHNSSSPVLAPFFPPDEPDLLLVYYIKNNLDSNLYETSEEFNAVNLIEIIDVTTGYRIPIPSINQSSCEHTCSTGFSSSVLNKLTSCCPQNYKVSSSHYRKKLIHELNNCLMAGRLESLKLLVDPQGNDTLPLYCICCLDYGSLPTILLHSLPVKVQRLIVNRLAHTNLPQFILTTHKGGHWSLVQLHYTSHNINDNNSNNNNNSQTIPSNSTPSLNESHMANCLDSLNELKDVDSESPVCTNCVSSIEFNLDPYTTAYFSDSYVKFMLTTKTSDKNWHCPFCKASYSLSKLLLIKEKLKH
ncbi:unnamed protein product [Schistosoma margrebowiei]|uniref:Uncharacterized protein n=1 Tax=Schistosoma margrebowiei TaxID=48269 RepID=A0A183M671_9TREM|nr:unnamed protein product [Schistosoma margrebowiei]